MTLLVLKRLVLNRQKQLLTYSAEMVMPLTWFSELLFWSSALKLWGGGGHVKPALAHDLAQHVPIEQQEPIYRVNLLCFPSIQRVLLLSHR